MKSTVLFVMILIIGAVGGVIAAEVKPMLFPTSVSNNNAGDDLESSDAMTARDKKFEERIKALEKANKEKDIIINDLAKELESKNEALGESEENVVSKNEEINNLQRQINELRGTVKALQQNIPNMVSNKLEKEKEEEEARQEAERAERMKEMQESIKKRQEEAYVNHTNKMKEELGLSDSQAQSIKEALNQRGEKLREMFSNGNNAWGRGNRDEMRQKMDEIQKEWEESAKSVLTPQQYDQFVAKNLNQVSEWGRRPDRGGNRSNNNDNNNNNPRPR